MTYLGVKSNVLMESHSSNKLSHQIDFSSWLSPSEFSIYEIKLDCPVPGLRNSDEDDTKCEYEIIIPGNEIPKWFNHQSIKRSISFWIGLEFPTFALCIAFQLDGLTNTNPYNYICVVNILTNGHKRLLKERVFDKLESDHQWFYGVPNSQLQQEFGDLIQGNTNHVEIACKISLWTSTTGGKVAPIIVRLGVYVDCICYPQNLVIIIDNCENVGDSLIDTELPFYHLFSLLLIVQTWIMEFSKM